MGKVIRNDPTPPVDVEFDQYQRYAFLRRITLAAYSERAAAREPITILDVGSGPERLTERFLGAGFAVTRCDVESFGQDDIVVIPAGGPLPFGDEAFEAVVALEVLEHVRPEARRRLVEECLRIARDLAVFSCPDNRPEVIEAERGLSAAFELLTGHEHPFLAEHAEWGLPTEESVRQLIHDAGVVPLVIGNSPLDRWQAFLMLDQVLRTLDRGPEIATGMYRRANESWPGCCARNPYRRFYVAPKSTRVASAVGAAIAEENGDTTPELVDPLFQLARIAAAELSAREVAHMHARAELLDAAHRRKIEAQRAEELAQTIQGLRDEAAGLKREAAAAGDRAAEAEASTRLLTGQLEVLASTLTAAAGVDRAPRSRLASTVRQLTQRAWTNHPYAADESASVTNVRSATHSLWCFAGRGSLRLRTTLEPGTYRIHCRALASLPTELDVRIGARRLRASMPQHEAKPVSTDVSLESMAEDVEVSLDPVVPASVLADLQILRRVDEPLTTAVRRNAIALARRRRTLLRLAQTRIGRSLTVRLRPPPPPLPPGSSNGWSSAPCLIHGRASNRHCRYSRRSGTRPSRTWRRSARACSRRAIATSNGSCSTTARPIQRSSAAALGSAETIASASTGSSRISGSSAASGAAWSARPATTSCRSTRMISSTPTRCRSSPRRSRPQVSRRSPTQTRTSYSASASLTRTSRPTGTRCSFSIPATSHTSARSTAPARSRSASTSTKRPRAATTGIRSSASCSRARFRFTSTRSSTAGGCIPSRPR